MDYAFNLSKMRTSLEDNVVTYYMVIPDGEINFNQTWRITME